MATHHFATGQLMEANRLVVNYHYSRRVPSNIQVVGTWHQDGGLFGDSGPAVAACYFSVPPTRWAEPVWELSRLVRAPDMTQPLTGLISATVRHIKRRFAIDVNLLVSFADTTHDHHGGIYQAASWNYHGQRAPSMDGVIINGTFIPGRTCNSVYGTRSPTLLSERLQTEVTPHYDQGKHLYWIPLRHAGKRQADRLNLNQLPYPKPAVPSAIDSVGGR